MSLWRQVIRGLQGLLHRDVRDREIDSPHHIVESAKQQRRIQHV